MQQVQSQSIIYNFDLNQNEPLDARQKIASLGNLPPLQKRYPGLIFHVVSENIPYIFLNDLTTPQPLFALINANNIFGVTSSDYTNLIAALNNTSPVLGSIVTVYPLKVTFIYNGSAWEYHSGTFHVTDSTQFTSIPTQLLKPNLLVLVGVIRHIINGNLLLSTEVIELATLPNSFENNRYFKIGGNLYYSINGVFYKIGDRMLIFENFSLSDGLNTILHNLNSTYISLFFWINNTGNITKITEYKTVSPNEIEIESYTNVTGTILITTVH